MRSILTFGFVLMMFVFSSCGPENDAKDVCSCYKEVIKLKGTEADDKMNECLDLLSKYLQSHEEAGTLDEFNKAYNLCR
jgi:hypothetical protein